MADFETRRRMMVDNQIRPADVTKYPVIRAMQSVPREAFVPAAQREAAYVGDNLDLGRGRCLLEPRTLAKMLDSLDITPSELVLDIGAGLGYTSAVIAQMAEAVVAVEERDDLAVDAQRVLVENGADNVAVIEAPLAAGAPRHGPYDVIVIEGGVEAIPAALTDQLKDGGRIAAIFVEGDLGICRIGHKLHSGVNWRFAFNASAPVLPGFAQQRAFAL